MSSDAAASHLRRIGVGVERHPPPWDEPAADSAYYLQELYNVDSASPLVHAYYRVRPFIPRGVQLAARRAYARRQRKQEFPGWPIEDVLVRRQYDALRRELPSHGSRGVPMVNFWPEGHGFAFVLTHDVEAATGMAGIEPLRELERRYGFVSSWNFCALEYPIPDGLFAHLRDDGCEIGLHGLDHRCRLFESRATFEGSLPLIHRYLREWDAAGFRSPSLHRNAGWMPELGSAYDSSFPDTDPFEPQPGGCCSILPYFIGDMVELPITLTQDHTLFEILREPDIHMWRLKAEWIIRHHGLINVIVHPDYMLTRKRLELYEQLLAFLAGQQGGWHALPRDVAAWWRRRAELRCEPSDGTTRIVGPEHDRATVAFAREQHGRIVIAP